MAARQLAFSNQARSRMMRGIDLLSTSVGVTLGPKGRNVVLEKDYGAPRTTKDGVTVARDLELGDKLANMGVQMVREVALRVSYKAGDGTTTATILADAIAKEGARLVAAGVNPMDLKRGIDAGVDAIVEDLRRNSREVSSSDEIVHVGTISANGDAEIGQLLARAMSEVGNDGIITVEPAESFDTKLDVLEGMQFDRGYISPAFVTNPARMRVELEEPYVLIVDRKLSALNELLPLLDAIMEAERPLFIVAEGVEGETLATLAVNKTRGSLKVGAVKSPGYGPSGKALLQDIAILTGGYVICEDLGIRLENASIKLLGRAKRVFIEKNNTTIVKGDGNKTEIEARIREIKSQITDTTSDYDREKLKERIARLSGGVAVIKIGGASELAVLERKDRVDNALHATRAAIEEGIVPGGGVALLRSARILDSVKTANEDQRLGLGLLRKACASPARQIAYNAGEDDAIVIGKIIENDAYAFGYDAQNAEYGDLLSKGIIDPTKVVRTALQAAASVAGLLITTEAMVADLHERVEPEGHHHHHHDDMDIDF